MQPFRVENPHDQYEPLATESNLFMTLVNQGSQIITATIIAKFPSDKLVIGPPQMTTHYPLADAFRLQEKLNL